MTLYVHQELVFRLDTEAWRHIRKQIGRNGLNSIALYEHMYLGQAVVCVCVFITVSHSIGLLVAADD